jgi:hypothetical protein
MTALTAACDQLLLSAVQTLVTAQAREYYTIDCYVPNPLMPGQTVKIDNDDAHDTERINGGGLDDS